jgi:hypothetical protein
MTTATLMAGAPAPANERLRPAANHTPTWQLVLEGLREGLEAHHTYERLIARGVPRAEAARRAMSR